MMSKEQQKVLGRRLGFVIIFMDKEATRPALRYLDGQGDLSRHGREPTECELRMWHLLVGQPYEAWSLTTGGLAQAALARAGVGVPIPEGVEEDGATKTPGEAGS